MQVAVGAARPHERRLLGVADRAFDLRLGPVQQVLGQEIALHQSFGHVDYDGWEARLVDLAWPPDTEVTDTPEAPANHIHGIVEAVVFSLATASL